MENKVEVIDDKNDIQKAIDNGASLDELCRLTDKYLLNKLRYQTAKDAEIAEPKQLPPIDNEKHEINQIQTA